VLLKAVWLFSHLEAHFPSFTRVSIWWDFLSLWTIVLEVSLGGT
jgi:hypothetical protein